MYKCCCLLIFFFLAYAASAQQFSDAIKLSPVAEAWASNSVNTVVFRKNSLVSSGDTQYIAFYDTMGYVVLGKRSSGSHQWYLKQTSYRGNTSDAHNSISIMVDGAGFLHLAWDHHNNELRYCRSIAPGLLEMGAQEAMTGQQERSVTYPEFYRLPNGNLLFLYRDGASGSGNLVINRYDIKTRLWQQLHRNLLDGEGKRNAYWQACVDVKGTIHISWVWRETADVSSNHDLCYARSADGGDTWTKSNGDKYQVPVTADHAEYIKLIPPNSGLINQTSMYAGPEGQPFIASYWREKGSDVIQYHLLYRVKNKWEQQQVSKRHTDFKLGGTGTKRIPVSRPQVIAVKRGNKHWVGVIFRDDERGDKFSIAINKNIRRKKWNIIDLTAGSVGSSEPTYDTELWKWKNLLHLFVQYTEQIDGEGKALLGPRPVSVLEWNPGF